MMGKRGKDCMKHLAASLLTCLMLCCILASCGAPPEGEESSVPSGEALSLKAQEPGSDEAPQKEMRAVWITYYEISMKAQNGGDESLFYQKVDEMFSRVQNAGFNTVIVQVRPYSDAFYPSRIFPWSAYLTGTQGKDPGYDPLAILVERAHAHGLFIHAWFNPYRVSYNPDFALLSKDNPARKWKEDADKTNDGWLIVLEKGIYYNPAVPEVQRMIIDGVREIVEQYEVDGVHMDDYFYPSTEEKIDQAQYDRYVKDGGQYSRAAWRRENVNTFVSGLYAAVKAIRPTVSVGISPAGDIEKNREELYADAARWGGEEGYVDYLMPQLYYGFENSASPFEKTARQWANLIRCDSVKLYAGLAIYKSGEEDQYAGPESDQKQGPRYEWINHSDIISRQVAWGRKTQPYAGFALYSYQYSFGDSRSKQLQKEWNALSALLENKEK